MEYMTVYWFGDEATLSIWRNRNTVWVHPGWFNETLFEWAKEPLRIVEYKADPYKFQRAQEIFKEFEQYDLAQFEMIMSDMIKSFKEAE